MLWRAHNRGEEMSGNWVKAAAKSDVGEGEVIGATLGGKEIALYNIDGEIFATDNVCTHAFAMLSDGWLDGDVIECPLHGGRFEVKTGKGLGPPIPCDLKTYPTRLVGEDVEVDLGA
jgi:naphthalene 1,2-dioxygenase ferredoxin component